MRKLFACCAAAFILAAPAPGRSAGGIPSSFDDRDAVVVEAVAPVVNDDVHQAHRAALKYGFRRALSLALDRGGNPGRSTARILDQAERYIRAYRIDGQERLDLSYRLTLSIWVDSDLLLHETPAGP